VLSLAANFFGLFLYFSADKQNKLSSAAKYPLLNPTRGLVNKEDLIVNIQPLRDEFNKFEGNNNVSIYFEYLNTGANISVNKDAEFWPASLLKVPVTMAAAKKIELGQWRWDNKLVLMSGDKDEKFGTLYKQPTGSTYTIEELVRRALADSDNTANFILVRNLELREIEDVYDHLGTSEFFSKAGNIGAKKYSANFRALYNSSYLSEEYSQKLLDDLSQTEFDEYLKSGLPESITFAHKIGVADDRKVYMDSGIVYVPNRPYLLTVMVSGKEKKEAENLMKIIAEQSFNYVNSYKEN
jgi:beta-lactamase class A